MLWGLLVIPGAKGVIVDSDLLAVGLIFPETSRETIRGLTNTKAPAGSEIRTGARRIGFEGCTLGAWNVYAVD